jgi:hypothetical protein
MAGIKGGTLTCSFRAQEIESSLGRAAPFEDNTSVSQSVGQGGIGHGGTPTGQAPTISSPSQREAVGHEANTPDISRITQGLERLSVSTAVISSAEESDQESQVAGTAGDQARGHGAFETEDRPDHMFIRKGGLDLVISACRHLNRAIVDDLISKASVLAGHVKKNETLQAAVRLNDEVRHLSRLYEHFHPCHSYVTIAVPLLASVCPSIHV